MISKKKPLSGHGLCVILDCDLLGHKRMLAVARAAVLGGASMLQLRAKRSSVKNMIKVAKVLKKIAGRHGASLIINDRLEVAVAAGAHGLHVGQGDIPAALAKKILGKRSLIGVSVSNPSEARRAERRGADYLGAGPIFKTPIKSSRKAKGIKLLENIRGVDIPFFAIGGIDISGARALAARGFRRIAVIRAVCKARDPLAKTMCLGKVLLS